MSEHISIPRIVFALAMLLVFSFMAFIIGDTLRMQREVIKMDAQRAELSHQLDMNSQVFKTCLAIASSRTWAKPPYGVYHLQFDNLHCRWIPVPFED